VEHCFENVHIRSKDLINPEDEFIRRKPEGAGMLVQADQAFVLVYSFTLSNPSCLELTSEPEKKQNEDIQECKGGHDQQRDSVDKLFDGVTLYSW
jgi:hypothetical protein